MGTSIPPLPKGQKRPKIDTKKAKDKMFILSLCGWVDKKITNKIIES